MVVHSAFIEFNSLILSNICDPNSLHVGLSSYIINICHNKQVINSRPLLGSYIKIGRYWPDYTLPATDSWLNCHYAERYKTKYKAKLSVYMPGRRGGADVQLHALFISTLMGFLVSITLRPLCRTAHHDGVVRFLGTHWLNRQDGTKFRFARFGEEKSLAPAGIRTSPQSCWNEPRSYGMVIRISIN
jgi:hypothetical protein